MSCPTRRNGLGVKSLSTAYRDIERLSWSQKENDQSSTILKRAIEDERAHLWSPYLPSLRAMAGGYRSAVREERDKKHRRRQHSSLSFLY